MAKITLSKLCHSYLPHPANIQDYALKEIDLDWQDGDINVAEQILTIHKRWAFEAMDRRILWRIASGHENL